jgi:hypothetical protein
MSVSMQHLFRQGPVLRTLLRTAVSSVGQGGKGGGEAGGGDPGPVLEQTVPPRNPRLVLDYIRHVGGEPSWYKGGLPPHFFPQWGFPLMARTLQGLPYNMSRVLNGGSRIEVLHPLPADQPLLLKAQLVEVDDNGSRVILRQKLVTGTVDQPEALVSYVNAIIPLKRSDGPGKAKPVVPETAREIDSWRLSRKSGLDFALLTGDFNPVHWVPAYARMSGFSGTILHGFATMARTIESLNRTVWMGRPRRLRTFESRFVKPLRFPGSVKVYLGGDNEVFVGDARGGPACLTGKFTTQ